MFVLDLGGPLWGGLSKEKLMGEGLGGICSSGPTHQGGEAGLWMEQPGLYSLITKAPCPSPTVKFTTLAAMRERGWGGAPGGLSPSSSSLSPPPTLLLQGPGSEVET